MTGGSTHRARVLVTGAGGFLGAHVTRRFLDEGFQVDATLRPGGNDWRRLALQGSTTHEVDLASFDAVRALAERVRPEIVVHCAFPSAYAGLPLRAQVAAGPLLLANLMDALDAAGVRSLSRFVHLGSFLEYGPSREPHRESDLPRPASVRGSIKAAETQLVLGRTRYDALPGVVLRVFSAFGPWEHSHRLVPTACRAALDDDDLPLTSPGIGRDLVHAADVAESCRLAATATGVVGEVINVGGGRHVTNEEVVCEIERVSGRRIRTRPGTFEARTTDGQVSCADVTKARRLLGWEPGNLAVGLKATLAWAEARRAASDLAT